MAKNPIVHSTKLWGGRETAMEIHRRLAWGNALCTGCKARDIVLQVQTFVALKDMSMSTRMELEFQVSIGKLHTVRTGEGPAIRTGLAYACPRCKPAIERAIARSAPSYVICDRDEGPGEDKPMVSVLLPE